MRIPFQILLCIALAFIVSPVAIAKEKETFDLNEPNNTINEATPVDIGWAVDAILDGSQDEDWYKLEVPVRGILGVEIEAEEAAQLTATITDASGNELGVGGARLAKEGEVFIHITTNAQSPIPYVAHLIFLENDPDIYEPNDSSSNAKPIILGSGKDDSQALTLAIFPNGDEDWFRFSIKKAGYVVPELFGAPEWQGVNLELKGKGGLVSLNEAVRLNEGEFLIKVSAYKSSIQPFNLILHLVEEMDVCEPNDTPESACRLNIGEEKTIALFPSGDVDWFVVRADRAGIISLSLLDAPAAEYDKEGELISGLKLSVESRSSSDSGGDSPLVRATPRNIFIEAKKAGDYYFSLRGEWRKVNPLQGIRITTRLLQQATASSGESDFVIVGVGIRPDEAAHLELPLVAGVEGGTYINVKGTDDVNSAL